MRLVCPRPSILISRLTATLNLRVMIGAGRMKQLCASATSIFQSLPSAVRIELEHHGCTIPQPYGERVQEMSVVSGHFVIDQRDGLGGAVLTPETLSDPPIPRRSLERC